MQKNGLKAKDEKEVTDSEQIIEPEAFLKSLQRAKNKYFNNWLYFKQTSSNNTSNRKNESQPYNFILLKICEWIVNNHFVFFDLLQNKKYILKASNKSKHKDLRNAFENYLNLLNNLESDSVNNRAYVVSAMAIMELEQSLYTTLFLYFAYLKNIAKIDLNVYDVFSNSFWIPLIQFIIFNQQITENSQIDLLSYPNIINFYKNTNNNDYNIANIAEYYNHIILSRCFANDLLVLFRIHFYIDNIKNISHSPNTKQDSNPKIPKWTEEDYKNAANFFKKEYPVITQHPLKHLKKCMENLPPDEWNNNMLKDYRNLFCNQALNHLYDLRQE